ncbi:hypothetical protein BSU01_18625 [Erwinia billingiae]|uniref:hypothetical protein n=1 Tax=Erwinia billingiae TaxID=182337 RepID=UPI0019CFBDC4|nr:hypothetical protein [Erwinia billingiae]MBN7123702.1 hypothetical protein [Erwinia billingiae]
MYNKNSHTFENHFLNMHESIENNLNIWRHYHAVNLINIQVISPQNAWLNCGESVDKVLQQVQLQSKSVAQQAGVLNRYGLLSKQMQGMVDRFQALGVKLAEQSVNSRREEIYQEYQQLADHIMPTLERINQRVEARREAVGIKAETKITPPVADETVNVALRAALKRRS